jgi:zinc protease
MKSPAQTPSGTIVALALVAAGCAAAELPDRPMPRPFSVAEEDITLGSGLRILVQEDHSAPVVTVVSTYSVGSTSDPKGREGLAHLVEHLAFRTHFYDGDPIWEHLKHMGASFNATTDWDFTNYFTTVHKDYLPKVLQMEAWRLFKNVDGVTPATFATEREVVRQEHRLGSETRTGSKMFDTVAAALFPPGHPLSRGITGTHDSTSAMTLEDAQKFVRDHYRPDNCTIVVTGDVDAKEVKKLIGTWPPQLLFGPGGPNAPKAPPRPLITNRPQRPVPPPVNTRLIRDKGPVSQPELWVAWSAPGGMRHNDALLNFLQDRLDLAFGQGIEVKYEDDDIEGISANVDPLIDGSIVVVQASLRPGADPEKVRTRVLDAMVNAWTTEFGRSQVEATRWASAIGLLQQTSQMSSYAQSTAQHLAATGSTQYFKDTFDDLLKIQASEVTALAYEYLKRERAVAVYIEPETEDMAKLVGGSGARGNAGPATHDVGRGVVQAAGDFDPTRIMQIMRSPGLASLPRWKLANGLEVVAVKHGTAPLAQIAVAIRGGNALTRPYGLASYADGFARSRCIEHGNLDNVGGGLGRSTGATSSTFSVSVMSGNLVNGIAVLSDQLACREVDEASFQQHDRLLTQRTKNYERAVKRPNFVANKRLFATLYPDHPYGVLTPDPATLKTVSFEDASAYVRSHYRPGNAVAVVLGDIDPNETRVMTEKYLGRWTGGGAAAVSLPAPPPPPTERKVYLVDRPGATQGEVNVACRLVDVTAEKLPAYDVAEAVASDLAWSVREEWGASYGVSASITNRPGGASHMAVGGAIETRWVARSINRLLGILEEVASPKLEEKLFLVKRWDVARTFTQRFNSGPGIAGAILEAADMGWSADVWDKYPERLAATDREAIRAILKPCVGHEIVAIAGDATVLRPQLEALGLKLESN